MRIARIVCDVAVTVGCCIGVGFISGKEMQIFFGNGVNVAIFAVIFFAANCAVREYCRHNNCSTVDALGQSLIGKPTLFTAIVAMCCFTCMVTVLAGVEQCLAQLFFIGKTPLYAFVSATLAAILLRAGMKTLKVANIISVTLAIILFVVLYCQKETQYAEDLQVPLYMPVVYALFSLTMALGVTSQLATDNTKQDNVIASLLSTVAIALLILFVLPLCTLAASLPTLSNVTSPTLLIFTAVTMLLATVTCLVANSVPVLQLLRPVVNDDTLCSALIFGLALALSMFGFDFAVRVGYCAVSIVGAVLVGLTVVRMKGLSDGKSKI